MEIEDWFKNIDWGKLSQRNLGTEEEVRELIKEIEIDIAGGITKIRIFVERLVCYSYDNRWGKDRTSLAEKIKYLNEISVFPPKILNYINHLRSMGNLGPHANPPSIDDVQVKDAQNLFPDFFTIIDWFIREELPRIDSQIGLRVKNTPEFALYCETAVTIEEKRALEELERLCHFPLPPAAPNELIQNYIGFAASNGHVTSLSLYNQSFKEIPLNVRYFKHLRYLNLQGNQLQSLPAWIVEFTDLEVLNVSHNPISQLPGIWNRFFFCSRRCRAALEFFGLLPITLSPFLRKIVATVNLFEIWFEIIRLPVLQNARKVAGFKANASTNRAI